MIGDVIQTTASVADLRRAFPESHIAYMTGKGGALVLARSQLVDDVLPYLHPPTLSRLPDFFRQVTKLRRRRFDVGVTFNNGSWDALLLLLAGACWTAGCVEPGREFLLDEPQTWDEEEIKARQTRFDELIASIGVQPSCRHYSFPATQSEIGPAVKLVLEAARDQGKPILAFAPGGAQHPPGGHLYRQWLPARFATVIDALLDEHEAIPVLLGDHNDVASSASVLESIRPDHREFIHNLTGQTSIEELGALLRETRLLVTNDSAPVWIAAAVDCPVVSIFGSNSAEINMPLARQYAAVSCNLPCHPCYRGDRLPSCSVPPPCVMAVSVEQVLMTARNLLDQPQARAAQ